MLRDYAENELRIIGMLDSKDEMNRAMTQHILKMVDMFAEEGHSGFSAAYAVGILEKLLKFEPLSPLTGEDWEWMEVGDQNGTLYQNVRCSRVFKDDNGAYNIDGKVFIEPDGCSYTSKDSLVPITFPYTPKTEYIILEK